MPSSGFRRRLVTTFYLLAAALPLVASGCLAVAVGGAAAGGAVGYAYLRGGLSQDFRAGLNDTWTATHAALADLGMPALPPLERKETTASVESQTGDGTKVHLALETRPSPIPAEGPLTRVNVRVGVFGEKAVSEKLLAQIQLRLTPALQPVPLPPAPGAPTVVVPAGAVVVQPPQPPGFPQTGPPPLAPADGRPPSR